MGLLPKKNKKTWQELKAEEDEAERLKLEEDELKKINEKLAQQESKILNVVESVVEEVEENKGLTDKQLKKLLKKFPRRRRKKLKELYKQYQEDKVLKPSDSKMFEV